MACNSGGFGSSAFGSGPFGSGSILDVSSAVAIRVNAIQVDFLIPPQARDAATFWDALRPANWTVTPLSAGALPRLVQYVERISSTRVHVYVDGPLSSLGLYRISVENLRDISGIPLSPGCAALDFRALEIARVPLAAQPGKSIATDLANPQDPADASSANAALGTFQRDDQGDIAVESGRAYLRKRVLRRATSSLGAYFHLPTYGFSLDPKTPIREASLRRIQTIATTQIRQEPDVVSANVSVRQSAEDPEIVFMSIRVRDNLGNDEMIETSFRLGA